MIRKLIFIFLFFSLSHVDAFSEVLDRVVASVDGNPISESELLEELKKISPNTKIDRPVSRENLKAGITALLLDREAGRLGVSVSQEELDQQLSAIISRSGISKEQFEKSISEAGITLEQYRAKLASELNRNRVLGATLKSRVQVNDEDLSSYVKAESQEDSANVGKFGLLKIFSPTGASDFGEEAGKLKEFLLGGNRCGAYKSTNVTGCEFLGVFKLEDLKQDYANLISDLQDYSFSASIVEGGQSLRLMKVDPLLESKESSVKQNVREKLFEEKFKVEAEKFLDHELFEKYLVDLH